MLTLPQNIVCGYFDCSEFDGLTASPVRKITKYEIELYLSDGKTTIRDTTTREIKKNYIQISKPGQTGSSLLPFYTAYVKFDVNGELADILSALPSYFPAKHTKAIRGIIDELILLNECSSRLSLYSRLLALLDIIIADANMPSKVSTKNYEIVSEVKQFIENNAAKPIKLSDIAQSIHLSKIYLHNIFKESTGISPHDYLINCRIEMAKKLLWDTKIHIPFVAEQAGFGCQQYLNKVFKKETGMTPGEYRKIFQMNYMA